MVERDNKDTNLRTFNTAKVFAESILFPLMSDYKKFQRQSNFGSENLKDSMLLSEEIRDIERYNGLKAMTDTCYDLAEAIESTVRLKGNQDEMKQLNLMKTTLKTIKTLFVNNKEAFFSTNYKAGTISEALNRAYFDKIKETAQICYINIEMLMTRNKLLFADSADEYMEDKQIMEEIYKEYTEG